MAEKGLSPDWLEQTVLMALNEDFGGYPGRDVTSQAIISTSELSTAFLVSREEGVVAGLPLVEAVFRQVSARFALAPVTVNFLVKDGDAIHPGTRLVELIGPSQALLMGERTALNFLSRASGVASKTRQWAQLLKGTGATVLDTRKTMPGLRELDKYSVRMGGGGNKRIGLYDVAMVKDNHIVAAGSVTAAIQAVRNRFPDVDIQVEADTLEQAVEAVEAGAKFLLLDNMPPSVLSEVVWRVHRLEEVYGPIELEATGNLRLDNAKLVAETGVKYLSVGALTHSAVILDLALDFLE